MRTPHEDPVVTAVRVIFDRMTDTNIATLGYAAGFVEGDREQTITRLLALVCGPLRTRRNPIRKYFTEREDR